MKGINALHSRIPKNSHIIKDDELGMLNPIEKEERDITTLWYLLSVIKMDTTEYLEINLPIYTEKYLKIIEQVLSNTRTSSYTEITLWKRRLTLQRSPNKGLEFNIVVNVKED